jgi:uncharacterized protein (DUF924 family)
MTQHTHRNVLDFWFGSSTDSGAILKEKMKLWFVKDPENDQKMKSIFGYDVEKGSHGHYDNWSDTPEGRLGLIILLDQFSRNIYRNTPESFANDPKALMLSLEAIDEKIEKSLIPIYQVFYYMPLMHSEEISIQRKCVEMFKQLQSEVDDSLKKTIGGNIDYAIQHMKIVERFHRFPHRNAILGRASTEEEVEFLKEPGSSF